MTQEQKQLLLKDLCARLPYGVKVHIRYGDIPYGPATVRQIDVEHSRFIFNFPVPIENGKPYLRPMSSMTEEEREEYLGNRMTPWAQNEFGESHTEAVMQYRIDFLLEHYLDYRGLIEKGLALEAPEGMYKTD